MAKFSRSRGTREHGKGQGDTLMEKTETENKVKDPYVSEEVCREKHRRVDEKLDCYDKDIKSINQKITATLVFMIIVLVTLLVDMAGHGVHI
jgi:hypothetical protein